MLNEIFNGLTALGTIGIGAGLYYTRKQLTSAEAQNKIAFEDASSREYREIIAQLPVSAFFECECNSDHADAALLPFFRYFDLSNDQLYLATEHGRVSDTVVTQWTSGIAANMALPAFRRAWEQISASTPSGFFEYLEKLVEKSTDVP